MYMDGIKLFAKMKNKWKLLYTQLDIESGHRNGIWHWQMCQPVMKSGKRYLTDGMKLPNQDKIRTLAENKNYIYFGILEAGTIKQIQMKDNIQKEYLRRTRKLLETKHSCRKLIKGINTWAVPLVRYYGSFLKLTRDGLKQMDQRTRKLKTIHKALHPREDVERQYVSRKEEERGFASIEDTVDASTQRLKGYREKHEGGLIIVIGNDKDNTMDNRMTTRKQKWEEKQHYWRFIRLINISHDKTWNWLRNENIKRETESLLIKQRHKARIDKTQQNSKCRLCSDRNETINHIVSKCSKLAQTIQDWMGKMIHWKM